MSEDYVKNLKTFKSKGAQVKFYISVSRLILSVTFSVILLVKPAYSLDTLTAEQKLSDLQQLVSMIKAGYGPLKYKKDFYAIDVDTIHELYKPKVLATKSNGEFYYTVMNFISEFHDGHFRATLPTDFKAALPIETDLVAGKVLIDTINREKLTEEQFPFAKGDEIISVNAKPIAEVLNELQSYRGLGFEQSERRTAAVAVSFRDGRRMPVPQGDVVLEIRRGTSEVIKSVTLKWDVTGTSVDEEIKLKVLRLKNRLLNNPAPKQISPNRRFEIDDISTFNLMSELTNPMVEKSFRCSGKTRIEKPKDATLIMEAPFVAYYYPTAHGNIGYLRLPHYTPPSDPEKKYETDEAAYEARFYQYEYAVSELEKNTVGIVIDQDHNCGGSVAYLHQILSLFAASSFAPMQFELLANKLEFLKFDEWAKELPENTLARKNIERVRDLIKDSWTKNLFMTPKTSLTGESLNEPNFIRYTKPIVVLIDEMSGSGGDAFPAIMQGLGRAKLVGTRTMGLGGHVTKQAPLFYSQITPEMTKSLFYRPDGVAIENNGAHPDYPYSITRDDFVYGYHQYRAFYEQKLFENLNKALP